MPMESVYNFVMWPFRRITLAVQPDYPPSSEFQLCLRQVQHTDNTVIRNIQRYLLRDGELSSEYISIRIRENTINTTPLHLAILLGDPHAVLTCIRAGNSLHIPDRNGLTPLQLAGILGEQHIINLLSLFSNRARALKSITDGSTSPKSPSQQADRNLFFSYDFHHKTREETFQRLQNIGLTIEEIGDLSYLPSEVEKFPVANTSSSNEHALVLYNPNEQYLAQRCRCHIL